MAESMSKLVGDCKIEKLIKRDVPLAEKLDLPLGLGHNQNLFQECLTHFQMAESGAVGVQVELLQELFPILGPNQDPGPLAQLLDSISAQGRTQFRKLLLTFGNRVGARAHEVLTG